MAGLGEACSHIAAVLFYLEALARMQGTKTCTQEECQWIIPSYLKAVEYLPMQKTIQIPKKERQKVASICTVCNN